MFGQERLTTMMTRVHLRGAELLDEILRELASFTGSSTHQDDVTLLTVDAAAEETA
jgi:serine phosphatase RsbU (regulator of sigma subunit)